MSACLVSLCVSNAQCVIPLSLSNVIVTVFNVCTTQPNCLTMRMCLMCMVQLSLWSRRHCVQCLYTSACMVSLSLHAMSVQLSLSMSYRDVLSLCHYTIFLPFACCCFRIDMHVNINAAMSIQLFNLWQISVTSLAFIPTYNKVQLNSMRTWSHIARAQQQC